MTALSAEGVDDLAVELRRFGVAEGIGRPDTSAALRWLVPWRRAW